MANPCSCQCGVVFSSPRTLVKHIYTTGHQRKVSIKMLMRRKVRPRGKVGTYRQK